MAKWIRRIIIFTFLILPAFGYLHATNFPKSTGFINDFAGILDEKTKEDMNRLTREVEEKTSAEISVVTVSSLEGLTVEQYANELFRMWGIGKKGKDNGVLVLVAPNERKIRIEVGYGLEGILPDGLVGEIIRANVTPAFKRGDFAVGLRQGVDRIVDIVREGKPLSADEKRKLAEASEDRPPAWVMIPFFGLFVSVGFLMAGVALRAKAGALLLWGALFGGIPFGMSMVPFFNVPWLVLAVLAVGVLFLGYYKGGSPRWQSFARGKGHKAGGSGWIMGMGSGSGGSSSGGGFGGGSSGGGGASGSW
jgi:uncharacterized protein